MIEIYSKNMVEDEIVKLSENSRFDEMEQVMQHGSTTVLEHSVKVAYLSCKIADGLNINVDYNSLIRGALLHDYFLYDRKDNTHEGFHGFTHARAALKNAKEDFSINKIEEDIISKHMFPLNITPPKYKESWIVTMADKISASIEFFEGFKLAFLKLKIMKVK